MKKILSAILVILASVGFGLFAASPGHARAVGVGDIAPDFATQIALAGQVSDLRLSSKLKQGPVVLYFFPKVFTKGCTAEAHEFAEKSEAFNKLGATVIGLSGDKIEEIAKFSISECRDKFAVGRATPQIIKDYNVAFGPMSTMSNRTSFVIGTDGKIKMRFSDLSYKDHVSKSLEAARTLAAK